MKQAYQALGGQLAMDEDDEVVTTLVLLVVVWLRTLVDSSSPTIMDDDDNDNDDSEADDSDEILDTTDSDAVADVSVDEDTIRSSSSRSNMCLESTCAAFRYTHGLYERIEQGFDQRLAELEKQYGDV